MQPWKHAPTCVLSITYVRGIPMGISWKTVPLTKDESPVATMCNVEAWPVTPAAFERLLVETLVHWREQQLPAMGTEVHQIRWDDLMR